MTITPAFLAVRKDSPCEKAKDVEEVQGMMIDRYSSLLGMPSLRLHVQGTFLQFTPTTDSEDEQEEGGYFPGSSRRRSASLPPGYKYHSFSAARITSSVAPVTSGSSTVPAWAPAVHLPSSIPSPWLASHYSSLQPGERC